MKLCRAKWLRLSVNTLNRRWLFIYGKLKVKVIICRTIISGNTVKASPKMKLHLFMHFLRSYSFYWRNNRYDYRRDATIWHRIADETIKSSRSNCRMMRKSTRWWCQSLRTYSSWRWRDSVWRSKFDDREDCFCDEWITKQNRYLTSSEVGLG